MKDKIKLCIIGAGSSYSPELIEGIINIPHEILPIIQINMTDIDEKRMNIMANLSERMIKHKKREIIIKQDTDLEIMLEGVHFVIIQIRVGGMKGRYLDESIPLEYGIVGQETTGPGGMFKALRTIPHMINIVNTVNKIAPDAFILNYTNPSGMITEAVYKYSDLKMGEYNRFIGLCSGIPSIQDEIKELLSDYYNNIQSYTVGLNHLGFIYKITSDGKDVTDKAVSLFREKIREQEDEKDSSVISFLKISKLLNAIPIGYTDYYFFKRKMYLNAKEKFEKGESRAQIVQKLEASVLKEAAKKDSTTKPKALSERGGGGYSDITFSVLKAIYHNSNDLLTASVPNLGCIKGLQDTDIVEVVSTVNRKGAHGLPVGEIPAAYRGIIQTVKVYENLAVEAAVTKRKDLIIKALLNHPLAGDVDIIIPMVDQMLKAHNLIYN